MILTEVEKKIKKLLIKRNQNLPNKYIQKIWHKKYLLSTLEIYSGKIEFTYKVKLVGLIKPGDGDNPIEIYKLMVKHYREFSYAQVPKITFTGEWQSP